LRGLRRMKPVLDDIELSGNTGDHARKPVQQFAVLGRCFPRFLAVIGRCTWLLFGCRDRQKPRNSAAYADGVAVFPVQEQRKQRQLAVAALLP
jgi:hypothetical protein